MAKETRRQRRDARRAEGSGPSSEPTPEPAAAPTGDLAVAGGVPTERRRGGFIRESWAELLKVDWPNRAQVIQGTIVVIVACAVIGAYLWGLDQVFRPFVRDVLLGQ
jgi:preprotein translocase SecE subunit